MASGDQVLNHSATRRDSSFWIANSPVDCVLRCHHDAEPMSEGKTAGNPFPPTPWSLLLRMQRGSGAERARALETICETYWRPIYLFARMNRYSPEDAEDLTQEFLKHLAQDGVWDRVEREKGKLRSFLIGAFKRVEIQLGRKDRAKKRGGGIPDVPFHEAEAEATWVWERYAKDVAPERAYEQSWALAVFRQAMTRLEAEYAASNQARSFAVLQKHLMLQADAPQRTDAELLGMSTGAFRTAVRRMRLRLREHFHRLVRETVAREDDVEEEVSYLLEILRSSRSL